MVAPPENLLAPGSIRQPFASSDIYGALASAIYDVLNSFEDLRDQVQVIGVPKITDVERLGESGVGSRGFEVYGMLRALGYGDNNDQGGEARIDYADLKARSDRITALLHQAQDAFGKLHAYLKS